MNSRNDGGPGPDTSTDLYLVRIWKRRSGDGALTLHGKLQHAVSGASCHFEGLLELPETLANMMEQGAGSLDLEMESAPLERLEPGGREARSGDEPDAD